MKKVKTLRIFLIASLLVLCLATVCMAAVSVENVTSVVGPQVKLTADVTGTQATSYQWYTCDDANGTNSQSITGATNATYTTPYLDKAGNTYYKVVVNGTESAVATVSATMPTEPVVLMFNNAADLVNWSNVGQQLVNIYGKNAYMFVPGYSDGLVKITNASIYNDFYLQGYPYVVISASYPETDANVVDIYLGTDRFTADSYGFTKRFIGASAACDDGFGKLIINTDDGTYKSYFDGALVGSGTSTLGKNDGQWQGKMTLLRVDFTNGEANIGKKAYIEYVGFFPTEQMAIDYAGAMPYDTQAKSVLAPVKQAVQNGEFVVDYDEDATKDTYAAFVKSKIDALTANAVSALKIQGINTVDVTISDAVYAPAENIWEDGAYTFTLNILTGDKVFRRSLIKETITVDIKGIDIPDIYVPDVDGEVGETAQLKVVLSDVNADSYQWYTCDDINGTNPKAIAGATDAVYNTGILGNAGTYYYMVKINDTMSSNVATLTVVKYVDPVIIRFNNEKDLATFTVNGEKELVTVDGKDAVKYIANGADGKTVIETSAGCFDFDVKDYPYVVFSASYPDYTDNAIDLYLATDGVAPENIMWGYSTALTGMTVSCNDGFVKTIVNANSYEYKSYNSRGEVISAEGAKAGTDGITKTGHWNGKINNFRVDFSNGNIGKPCYIEYIAFFPTEEKAVAYAGEMPGDAKAQDVMDAVKAAQANGELTLAFCDAESKESVEGFATDAIEALTAEKLAELRAEFDTVEFSIKNAVYNRASTYGRGVYTFDICLLAGDRAYGRTVVTQNVTMTLEEKPAPVVVTFDSAQTVTASGISSTIASFVEKNTAGEDRSYMRIQTVEDGNDVDVNYKNFYTQSGSTFNFREYPYMKISYRRNIPTSVQADELMMVYAADNAQAYFIDPASDPANPYWEQMVVDMRDATLDSENTAITFYKEGASAPTYGSLKYYKNQNLWTGLDGENIVTPIAIRLTRNGKASRTVDIEYIAFFASRDEAVMYPRRLPENAEYDFDNLNAKNTFEADSGVVTKAQAEKAVEKYLDTFIFATNHTVDKENAVFIAPTSKAPGSYKVDVWFGAERKEEYTVTVTMTMAQLPEPVILYTDCQTTLDSLKTEVNANIKVEDGVFKMTTRDITNDDGFAFRVYMPDTMEQFKVTTLPYLKMKYKMSGITKDVGGKTVNPAEVGGQIFIWMSDPSYPALSDFAQYRGFTPYGGNFEDGDVIEVILDLSYDIPTNGIWVRNITKGETEYTVHSGLSGRNESAGTDKSFVRTEKTVYDSIRFTPVRYPAAQLDRKSEFYYAGFFATLEEAQNFDSEAAAAERLQSVKDKLESGIDMKWGVVSREKSDLTDDLAGTNPNGSLKLDGIQTQGVIANKGIKTWLKETLGMDAPFTINDYKASTPTEKGYYNFDITFESGYQKLVMDDLVINIEKKPGDYIIWRFNDEDIAKKLSVPSPSEYWIEDNLLKIKHIEPNDPSRFAVTINVEDMGTQPFDLEDYTYVFMKYKRSGDLAPSAFTAVTQDGTKISLPIVGWGQREKAWYYTIFDPTVRDIVTPWSFNYNITSGGEREEIVSCPFYDPPVAPPYRGLAKSFTFEFGARQYAIRYVDIEFIAFFPSMDDAKNYMENLEAWEDLVADTTAELKKYEADTVSYYDADTQTVAEAKAKSIIEDKLSYKNDVTVTVNTVSYTAPVLGQTDGSYTFTAKVTKDGKEVYTTREITLTIDKNADNSAIVYKFTNPKFISTVEGASDVCDYIGMKLKDKSFVLNIGADKPNAVSGIYNTIKLDADFEGGFTAIINGTTEIPYSGADGKVYLDISGIDETVDSIKIVFENTGAYVRNIGFFASESEARNYDFDKLPQILSDAKAAFKGEEYIYAYSKTRAIAKAMTERIYVPQKLANYNGVKLESLEYANYVASTATKKGSLDVTAKLAYGDKSATYYADAHYTITLAPFTEEIIPTQKSEGHEFLGYDTITANNNFASAANTIEFNIMVAQSQLGKVMTIVENGSATVRLVDGKITVNGTLIANTALKADTWTHVAITSGGKIYLDGVLDKSGDAVEFTKTAPVIGNGFVGHLLDVRFWSDIRTEAEIKANMATRTDSTGLLANWMLTADSYWWLEYRDSSAYANTAIFNSTGWYKMEAGLQGDYSIVQFGDTQSYFAKPPYKYERLPRIFEWIGDNIDTYNIGHVQILGDVTQTNTYFEWDVARESFDYIEGKVPYSIPLGNHDYPSIASGVGAELRDTTTFRNVFKYDDYLKSYGPEGDNTFGGTFRGEKELTNMYNLVTIGGVDYLFITLEYSPRDEVLEWVGEILTKYPERQAILTTHCYFSMDGTLTTENSTRNFKDGNEGQDIYDKIVTKYPNLILVNCGHSQGDDTKQHPHNRGSNYKDSPTADDFGNDVIQILSDISAYALHYPGQVASDGKFYDFGSDGANMVQFGADEGLIFVMMFKDGGRTMHTYVYSPLYDTFFRTVNEQTHTIKSIKAEPALNVVGTELREADTELPMGMRFKMTLSKSYKNFTEPNKIEVKGYGMVLVPADVVEEGVEVTADMFKGTNLENMVAVEECSDAMYYSDENRTDFTVVIHGIPTPDTDEGYAYSREILARAYVDYTVNGGEVQRLYSYKTLSCSMNNLVNP
ncbi:MAG: hypothetical protein E7588_05570 [Ruminococcaceae bacterium]|nr:hypothetical protein [Oscillospiraceae bacterium]